MSVDDLDSGSRSTSPLGSSHSGTNDEQPRQGWPIAYLMVGSLPRLPPGSWRVRRPSSASTPTHLRTITNPGSIASTTQPAKRSRRQPAPTQPSAAAALACPGRLPEAPLPHQSTMRITTTRGVLLRGAMSGRRGPTQSDQEV